MAANGVQGRSEEHHVGEALCAGATCYRRLSASQRWHSAGVKAGASAGLGRVSRACICKMSDTGHNVESALQALRWRNR
jgi:hypothetical protein